MATPFRIMVDPLDGPEIAALLQEHLDDVARYSPPESIHALDLSLLRSPDITFWSVWEGDTLVGCGALKKLSAEHAEIKSMRTANGHLRKGVASAVLEHMLDEARRRGYKRVSLETGAMEAFVPARALYERFGFALTGPYGDYVEDRNSIFMTLTL